MPSLRWSWAALLLGAALGADERRDRLAQTIAPLLAKPPCEGLLIYEVLPGLQAEKAGLQIGDILTHYDGKAVRTVGQLQGLARTAATENRGNLLVMARRGADAQETTLDAAPMGLRFVAVHPSDGRKLWRPGTPYAPNWEPLRKQAAARLTYGFLVFGDQPIGWSRSCLLSLGNNRYALRSQSSSRNGSNADLRDTTVVFDADRPTLRPLSVRTTVNNKPVLNVELKGGALRGQRFGIPDSAPLPEDALVAELAALAAAAMPRAKDACLRCSYLPSGALSAAPFADLCCLGPDKLDYGKRTVACFRYDQTEFGRSMVHLWLDADGNLLKARFGGGSDYARASSKEIGSQFPNAANEFPPIEQLPAMPGAAPIVAN